jgi:hypothetical protein
VLVCCQGSVTYAATGERANTPTSYKVSLPRGLSPTRIFTTTSTLIVIKAAADADHRSLYSWQPGNEPKLIVEGRDLDVTRLSGDTFAAWYSENSKQELVTLNAQQITSQPLMLPQGGPTGWQGCEGDTARIVCMGNRPGMSIEDKDYDEMGFSAVLVIDLLQQKSSWFPVKDRTRFRFDRARKIYVSDFISPSSPSSVEAFDLAGKTRGAAKLSDMAPSPSGHFAESLQEDGSVYWDIHEASSNKVLLAFNCGRPECKIGDRSEDMKHWNPVFDDQVIVLRDNGKAYGVGAVCDVYQISPPRLVKSIPCDGLPEYDWSRDGWELITLTYTGGEFRREPVNSP